MGIPCKMDLVQCLWRLQWYGTVGSKGLHLRNSSERLAFLCGINVCIYIYIYIYNYHYKYEYHCYYYYIVYYYSYYYQYYDCYLIFVVAVGTFGNPHTVRIIPLA